MCSSLLKSTHLLVRLRFLSGKSVMREWTLLALLIMVSEWSRHQDNCFCIRIFRFVLSGVSWGFNFRLTLDITELLTGIILFRLRIPMILEEYSGCLLLWSNILMKSIWLFIFSNFFFGEVRGMQYFWPPIRMIIPRNGRFSLPTWGETDITLSSARDRILMYF